MSQPTVFHYHPDPDAAETSPWEQILAAGRPSRIGLYRSDGTRIGWADLHPFLTDSAEASPADDADTKAAPAETEAPGADADDATAATGEREGDRAPRPTHWPIDPLIGDWTGEATAARERAVEDLARLRSQLRGFYISLLTERSRWAAKEGREATVRAVAYQSVASRLLVLLDEADLLPAEVQKEWIG